MTPGADRVRARRASLRVGLLVGGASAVIILLVLLAQLVVIRSSSHVENVPGPHGHEADRLVVEVNHILPWLLGIGLAAVVLLALIAWVAARAAVAPLTEALRLQRSFVSDASHELRTPLAAVSARIQILERRRRQGQDIDETIAELRHDADTLDAVLTDMLLTAEGEQAVPVADVDGAVAAARATIAPLAAAAHVELVMAAAPAGARAAIPAVTLSRLCVALLDNAVQHTPAGGTVSLSTSRSGRSIEIRVRDTGPGIPREQLDRIFERFARGTETGRPRGFGLGLALVRDATERYHGEVAVEASTPQGTTMLLRLPTVAA